MKGIKDKVLHVLLFFGLFSVMISCMGTGEYTGYNAPAGSSVTVPDGGDVKIPAGGAVAYIVDVLVTNPDGDPLNDIQMQMGCFQCEIYDKTDGSDYIVSDTPLEWKATPYMVKTNVMGFYQVEVIVVSPSFYGVEDYDADFWANIGFGSQIMTIQVKLPS